MKRITLLLTTLALVAAVPAQAQRLPTRQFVPLQPNPTITSLSVNRGSPGDRVVISGTGFGAQAGSVTFSVEPNSALGAPIVGWTDTSIEVRVPDVTGMKAPYAGELKVNTTLSAPFTFIPAMETLTLAPEMGDIILVEPFGWDRNVCHPYCASGPNLQLVVGAKGDDEFFRGKSLLNGWTVKSVSLGYVDPQGRLMSVWTQNRAAAQIAEQHVGTDKLYVKVHWWYDAFGAVAYVPRVVIQGPKGVPYR